MARLAAVLLVAGALAGCRTTHPEPVLPRSLADAVSKVPLKLATGPRWLWHAVRRGSPQRSMFATHFVDVEVPIGMSAVSSIDQLHDGRMVFGTLHGLFVWNGNELDRFTSPLPHNAVQDVLADSSGRIWAATSAGVLVADDSTWHVLKPDCCEGPVQGLSDVMSLFESSDGRVFIGSRYAGISVMNPRSREVTTIFHDSNMKHWVGAVAEDAQGNIWFAVHGVGILLYDGTSIYTVQHDSGYLSDDSVRAICVDGEDALWFGTNNGVGVLHPDGRLDRFTDEGPLPGNDVFGLHLDKAGRVWALTWDGIAIFDHGTWRYPSLGAMRVRRQQTCVYDLPDGEVWLGEYGHAVRRGVLIFGPDTSKAAKIRRLNVAIARVYPDFPALKNVVLDGQGRVVTGRHGRLLRYDGASWQDFSHLLDKRQVTALHSDHRGRTWVGTAGAGLIRMDPDGPSQFLKDEGPSSYIYQFVESADGDLYAGTQGGLYRLDGDHFTNLTDEVGMRLQVTRLLIDAAGRIWMVDDNRGLFVWDDGSLFQMPLAGRKVARLDSDSQGNILALVGEGEDVEVLSWNGDGSTPLSGLRLIERRNRD